MAKGKIVTFYSYKGGTGRSMALANVAWLLATSGKRVLTIDWDLEAPGLHRYFEPFLTDRNLTQSLGVIDFVIEFAAAAVAGASQKASADWYLPYSNLIASALSLNWNFGNGSLDFVPAGRQDAAYSTRVNSFDWRQFYERLGGGVLLETVKGRLRERYDYILIDSRTGVSDTAGVCTVQLPDELVACFTLNRQSTLGASAAALAAVRQRQGATSNPDFKVWPIPMRVETTSEKERLDRARTLARIRFSGVLGHLSPEDEDIYWGDIEVPYFPYYAFDETLATFADGSGQSSSFLTSMEKLTRRLTNSPSDAFPIDSTARQEGLLLFQRRSAFERMEEFTLLGEEYERIRSRSEPGPTRTNLMNNLVSRAQLIAGGKDVGAAAENLFRQGKPGSRIVGLALARKEPVRSHIEMALSGISESLSAFEQYHALHLARALVRMLDSSAVSSTVSAIQDQLDKTIKDDPSRYNLAVAIIKSQEESLGGSQRPIQTPRIKAEIKGYAYSLIECQTFSPLIRFEDPMESHGQWVQTRGAHTLNIPTIFRIGQYLVTNELYSLFVQYGGHQTDSYWNRKASRSKLLTRDKMTLGPRSWLSAKEFTKDAGNFPVSGVSGAEARAFVQWCNSVAPPLDGWVWALPSEDIWELSARTEAGLTYPWGDAFDPSRCNSAETGRGKTTSVDAYPAGASRIGCCDMAGNVWEFVESKDTSEDFSVMRGGSYKNNRFELRSYLRLFGVPLDHRASDFGFRLVQLPANVLPQREVSADRIFRASTPERARFSAPK